MNRHELGRCAWRRAFGVRRRTAGVPEERIGRGVDSRWSIVEPADHEHLVDLVRTALRSFTGDDPDEYAPGRFEIEGGDMQIAVLVTEDEFPAIRLQHRAVDIPEERRSEVLEFANALHGRTSTAGAYWWLGNEHLWQLQVLWAFSFNERIFTDHLGIFLSIAEERTEEIRARCDGTWLL